MAVIAYLDEREALPADPVLDEAGTLMSEAAQATIVVLAPEHRDAFASLGSTEDDLRRFAEELFELEDSEAGRAMREVLDTLARHLDALDAAAVLLLRVG